MKMQNDEIQAEVKRLYLLESSLLVQIKDVRTRKKKLVKQWTENLAKHEEETPIEREVKAAKK